MVHETVVLEGHLIDSDIMRRVFDRVVEGGGAFEVQEFRVGRTNEEASFARIDVRAEDPEALDAIVYRLHLQLKDQLPKNKLMGMAGVLDSGRYCYFVAEAANVSVENVNAMVLGGHGDTMVPVRSSCQVAGIPVDKFVDEATLAEVRRKLAEHGLTLGMSLGTGLPSPPPLPTEELLGAGGGGSLIGPSGGAGAD